jgi:hypothetical protein
MGYPGCMDGDFSCMQRNWPTCVAIAGTVPCIDRVRFVLANDFGSRCVTCSNCGVKGAHLSDPS